MTRTPSVVAAYTVTILLGSYLALAQVEPAHRNPSPQRPMTFFVTSVGMGKGADLGGLAGADAHCQVLAAAVGAGNNTWHAYLSTQARGNQPAMNAATASGRDLGTTPKGPRSLRIKPSCTVTQMNWRASAATCSSSQR